MANFFLLTESGSTKTDWVIFSQSSEPEYFTTGGLNPDINQTEVIEASLIKEVMPQLKNRVPSSMFFYGAGLRNPENRKRLKHIFNTLIPGMIAEIEHDLLGSARACLGDESGITCILGTGSNSCKYDGKQIVRELGGNGYLFGDEGSGGDFGKALIKKALDEELPQELITEMEAFAGMKLLDIRRSVHLAQKPNVELANWSPFVHAHLHRHEIQQIVENSFTSFLEKTVLKYNDLENIKVCFVGSIAFHFSEILGKTCAVKGIHAGNIIQHPAEALLQYHLQHENR